MKEIFWCSILARIGLFFYSMASVHPKEYVYLTYLRLSISVSVSARHKFEQICAFMEC
jgi:hypothetical protein